MRIVLISFRKKSGIALISALMVLVILAIIAGCFAQVMYRDSRQATESGLSVVALNAAEAGVDFAIWLHRHNMSIFPLVDYNGGQENSLPFVKFQDGSYHGDEGDYLYAAQGTVYNLPNSIVKNDYDPYQDKLGRYLNGEGSKNLDYEYMFVNELSYNQNDNFMRSDMANSGSDSYCVTFQIREKLDCSSIASNKQRIVDILILSTGKVYRVPDNYDWKNDDDWLKFWDNVKEQNSSCVPLRDMANKGFVEIASRTINTKFRLYGLDSEDWGNMAASSSMCENMEYPSQVESNSTDSELSDYRKYQMPERGKREWFR